MRREHYAAGRGDRSHGDADPRHDVTASGVAKPVKAEPRPTLAQASPPAAYATSGRQQEYPVYWEETGAVYVVYGGRVYIGQARKKTEAVRLAWDWLKDK